MNHRVSRRVWVVLLALQGCARPALSSGQAEDGAEAGAEDTLGQEGDEDAGVDAGSGDPMPDLPPSDCRAPEYELRTFETPGPVRIVTVGDFDEDGRVDVVGALNVDGPLIVMLDDDEGGFELGEGEELARPSDLVPADVDDDGHLDLVISSYTSGTRVLSGRGDGTFAPGVIIDGAQVDAVTVGDLDSDGILDVVAGHPGDTFASQLGRGDGSFDPPLVHQDAELTREHALGDFDEDGELDLLTHRGRLWLGSGDGSFVNNKGFDPPQYSRSVAVADIDYDGHLDGVVGELPDGAGVVAFGDGSGGFRESLTLDPKGRNLDVIAYDVDGSGYTDVVLANWTERRVSVYLGGNCIFDGAPTVVWVGTDGPGNYPSGLAHGDFDRDGIDDMVTANLEDDTISLLLTGSP